MGYLSPPPSPQPVVVYKDVGGLVSDYEAMTEAYRRENREVRLHECRSACTLALSLPNVCVYPDAQVKFHQAYNEITRETDFSVSAKLFDSYPAPVRARLGTLTRQYKVLSGVELISLGMRNCLNDDKTLIAKRRQPVAGPPTAVAAAAASPGADSLREIAQNIRVAVTKALAQPEGAPTQLVAAPDRSPLPPKVVETRLAAFVAPLPPRRPNFEAEVVAGPVPAAPPIRLINGAAPILQATAFAPLREEAERINLVKAEE
ncbi:MAG TPA: hypothetical protein VEH76_13055 [Methylocystis sp.]|nr:hypothetical protein [Methylocystis sp.]